MQCLGLGLCFWSRAGGGALGERGLGVLGERIWGSEAGGGTWGSEAWGDLGE